MASTPERAAPAFWDIGTPADYWRTSHAFAARERRAHAFAGRASVVHPFARVTRSILWDDVEIGPDAVIDECIVTDGVRIAGRASHRRSILVAAPGSNAGVAVAPLNLD